MCIALFSVHIFHLTFVSLAPNLSCDCMNSFEPIHTLHSTTGADCSIDISTTHWERVTTAPLPDTFTLSTLARGSHSAVVWGGYMLVYGGYRFPTQDYYYRPPAANETMTNVTREVSILRYRFVTKAWEEVKTYPSMNGDAPSVNSTNGSMIDDKPGVPQPRYGHSAVVYNVSYMYIVYRIAGYFRGVYISREHSQSSKIKIGKCGGGAVQYLHS